MKKTVLFQPGFTLVEVLIVIGLTTVLLGVIAINLVRPQSSNSVEVTATTLVADLKQQQLLAMMGDNGSQSTAQPHGVRLAANSYTLFVGPTFAASTNQFVINMPQGITISANSLPLDIIFTVRSGETMAVSGVSVTNTSGDQRSLTINRLGVINVN